MERIIIRGKTTATRRIPSVTETIWTRIGIGFVVIAVVAYIVACYVSPALFYGSAFVIGILLIAYVIGWMIQAIKALIVEFKRED